MNKFYFAIAGLLIAFVVIINSVYILDQRQTSLILQFGEPMKYETEPGLKLVVPFIQKVIFFDKRIQNLSAATSEVTALDQKNMLVDAFIKYKITDGLKFYQSVKDEVTLKARLSSNLESSLKEILGSMNFNVLLTPGRATAMVKIKDLVKQKSTDLGVEIVDMRIMRADLPDSSRKAVYDRMKTIREKEAKEIRAEGGEAAQKIIASAEKEKTIILADAKKTSEIIRGEGDSIAIATFAAVYNKDASFFEFYRSMKAYKEAFKGENSKAVLTPDSDFMKYFRKN